MKTTLALVIFLVTTTVFAQNAELDLKYRDKVIIKVIDRVPEISLTNYTDYAAKTYHLAGKMAEVTAMLVDVSANAIKSNQSIVDEGDYRSFPLLKTLACTSHAGENESSIILTISCTSRITKDYAKKLVDESIAKLIELRGGDIKIVKIREAYVDIERSTHIADSLRSIQVEKVQPKMKVIIWNSSSDVKSY